MPREDTYLTQEGEQALAAAITDYWRDRGHRDVKCRVEQQKTHHASPVSVVRSNLINGLPPSAFALSKGAGS
jgi:hypothetical protein